MLETENSVWLGVYVPASGPPPSVVFIAPGAGIVGSRRGDKFRVDFEENRHGRRLLKHYANRVFKAAEKHAEEWNPERTVVASEDLVRVGGWDPFRNEVRLEPKRAAELSAWLGIATIDVTDEQLIYRPT